MKKGEIVRFDRKQRLNSLLTKHSLNINTNIGRLKVKECKEKFNKADSAVLMHCCLNTADVACQL